MSNALISRRNYIDASGVSFGDPNSDWTALPLSNLQDPLLSRVTRTSGSTDTKFTVDLGRRKTITFVALLAHNLSTVGTWRVEIASDSNFNNILYDSSTVKIWPRTETLGAKPWGQFAWTGRLKVNDGDFGFLMPSSAVYGQYIRISLADTQNADGYLEAGRLITDAPWRPSINISYGWRLEFVNPSDKARSRGGQPWVNRLSQYRRITFDIELLKEDEMWGNGYEMDRQLGVAEHAFMIVDPDNQNQRHRQTIYGTLREPSAIQQPFFERFVKSFVIEETP